MKPGIYEEIINKKIKTDLDAIDIEQFGFNKAPLDVEEARKVLATYISQITRKALNFVRDQIHDDQEALLHQVQTCNEIISLLSERLDEDEFRALQIEEDGEVLTYLYSKINTLKGKKRAEAVQACYFYF